MKTLHLYVLYFIMNLMQLKRIKTELKQIIYRENKIEGPSCD
jgi:hypothetical protein